MLLVSSCHLFFLSVSSFSQLNRLYKQVIFFKREGGQFMFESEVALTDAHKFKL